MFVTYRDNRFFYFLKKAFKNYFEGCLAIEKPMMPKDKERLYNLRNEIDDIIEHKLLPQYQTMIDYQNWSGANLTVEYEMNNGFTIYTVEDFPLCPYQATLMHGMKFHNNILDKLGVERPYNCLVRYRSAEAVLNEAKQIFTDYAEMHERDFEDKYTYTKFIKGMATFVEKLANGIISKEYKIEKHISDLLDYNSCFTYSIGEMKDVNIKYQLLPFFASNGIKSSVKNDCISFPTGDWYDVVDCKVIFLRTDCREYFTANEVHITIRNTETNKCLKYKTLIDKEIGVRLGEYYTENVYDTVMKEEDIKAYSKRERVINNIESYKVRLKRQADAREFEKY